MDWVEHLLEGENSPLGFKRLSKVSARVSSFLSDHPKLAVTEQAKRQGRVGLFVPSMADTGNRMSVHISFWMMESLLSQAPGTRTGIVGSGQSFGTTLESRIASGLRNLLADADLNFVVSTKSDANSEPVSMQLTDYWPYLSPPSRPVDSGEAQVYRALGRGHLIQPDVVVWRDREAIFNSIEGGTNRPKPFPVRQLFACISGKATIRSDRSQSSRYEGSSLSRWRRARPPHIVVVTAEPSPSRLGSLAWGLGDLDAVYHVNLKALYEAVLKAEEECGSRGQKSTVSSDELKDLIEYARLKDLSQLFDDLFCEAEPLPS